MPHLHRRALRPLLATSLAFVALAASSAPALAISVTVHPTRGEPVPVATDDIEPDIIGAVYTVRERDGSADDVRVTGVSVGRLLRDTGLDYRTVEVTRDDGTTLVLSRKQINSSEPEPPVIYTKAGTTYFLRQQWREDDVNAMDHFPISGTLALTLRERSPIKVTVTYSPKKIKAGESVTFNASATGGRTSDDYDFHWSFGDGDRDGPEDEVVHTFEKPERYVVRVTASIPGEQESDPAQVEVTVGEPKESDEQPEPDPTGDVGTGPSGGLPGPQSTPDSPPQYNTPYSPATPAPYTPPPAPSKPAPPPDITTGGSFVEGNLLADAGDPPSGSILESAARAARADTPPDSDAGGGGVPEAALSLTVALALLGVGAALELRQARPRRFA